MRSDCAKLRCVALTVSFVRHHGKRDHVYVTRENGTTCDWAFPTYGDQLPHDLCHLVVEEMLGIPNGFWSLVEQGMEVRLINNQGTLVKEGRSLSGDSAFDFSGLVRAEEAVALLAPIGMRFEQAGALVVARRSTGGTTTSADAASNLGFTLPPGCSTEVVNATRERLRELTERWRSLDDGGAITLSFTRTGSDPPGKLVHGAGADPASD